MSQKGLLSENELAEHIHRYFDLRLDKDILLKPTADVVKEIYKRFLDKTVKNWMCPKNPEHEPTCLTQMLYWMERITQCYSTGYDFNINDLSMPTRKRTTAFLNVIVYVLAFVDEGLGIWQERQTKKQKENQKNKLIERDVADMRAQNDELAFKIGQLEPVEVIRKRLGEYELKLRLDKKKCDEMGEEKARVKEELAKGEEAVARMRIEIEESKRKLDEISRREELKSKISSVEDELSLAENALEKLRIQNDLKRTEERHQLKMIEDEDRAYIEQTKEKMKNILNNTKAIEDRKEDVRKKIEEDTKLTNDAITRAKLVVDDFKKRRNKDLEDIQREEKSILLDYKVQLDSLSGVHDTAPQESDKNKTFIKSDRQ